MNVNVRTIKNMAISHEYSRGTKGEEVIERISFFFSSFYLHMRVGMTSSFLDRDLAVKYPHVQSTDLGIMFSFIMR